MSAVLTIPVESPDMDWLPEDEGTPFPPAPVVPHNPEAERVIIGYVFSHPDQYSELAAVLRVADIYIVRHRWTWQAFENLSTKNVPLELLTVADELKEMGKLEEAGGIDYLTALQVDCPLGAHALTYVKKVNDCAVKRGLLAAAEEIAKLVFDPRTTAEEAGARALETVQENVQITGDIILRTLANAFEMHTPRQWVIENLIMEKSLTIIVADAGSKKTYICITIGEAVANGSNFISYTTHRAPVLYLDEENGSDEMDDRIKQVALGMGCNQEAPFYHVSYAGLMLDNPANCQTIKALIERTGAKLVIFDSLQDFMTGDENSKQDTQPIFTSLKRLANQTGAAILVQHHTGKNGDYRGSTTIKGNVDLMLEVKSEDDSDLITFKSKKNRKGTPIKFTAEATWWNDTFTLKPSTRQAAHPMSKAEDYVIRFFEGHPGATVEDAMNNADACTPSTAKKTLYNLAGRDMLRRTNPGERTARYEVSPVTEVLPESYQ